MNDNRSNAIKLKFLKAKTLLNEVDVLLTNKFYDTVINRLYYSCFHATKALLLTKDLVPKTHSGVVSALYKHFVQSGEFEAAHASFFTRLMQERIEGDYSDNIIEDEKNTKELVEPSRNYIKYIENHIKDFLD